MREKLFLHIKYTADDYIRAAVIMRKQRDQMFLYKYGFLIAFAATFLATVLFVFIVANDRGMLQYSALWLVSFILAFSVSAAILLLGKFVFPFMEKRSIKKRMKSSPSAVDENEVCISDEGIEISSELNDVEFKWESFPKASESDFDFIFYTSDQTGLFIPKHAFLYEADANFLRRLSREKLAGKARFYTQN